MAISSVTDREFSEKVIRHDAPVVVAFRSAWCVPSRDITSVIDEIAKRYESRIRVVAVDVDDDPKADKICRQYKVSRLPVTMIFKDGRVVDLIGGAAAPESITDMIDRQLRPVADVTEFGFDADVLKSPVPVLVHVDAAWCEASRELVPVVESMAETFRGRAKVVRLDFQDGKSGVCARYGFLRVPTLAVFHQGRLEDQILGPMRFGTKTDAVATSCVGLTTSDNVKQMLEQFVL